MIGVVHRRDPCAGKNIGEQLLELFEFRRHFLEQGIVVRPLSSSRRHERGRCLDATREEKNEPLPSKLAIDHRLPIPNEAFVATTSCPDIGGALRLLSIAQKISAVIRVAEPLHLQPQLVVQTSEQERELILERVEMFRCRGA